MKPLHVISIMIGALSLVYFMIAFMVHTVGAVLENVGIGIVLAVCAILIKVLDTKIAKR